MLWLCEFEKGTGLPPSLIHKELCRHLSMSRGYSQVSWTYILYQILRHNKLCFRVLSFLFLQSCFIPEHPNSLTCWEPLKFISWVLAWEPVRLSLVFLTLIKLARLSSLRLRNFWGSLIDFFLSQTLTLNDAIDSTDILDINHKKMLFFSLWHERQETTQKRSNTYLQFYTCELYSASTMLKFFFGIQTMNDNFRSLKLTEKNL